MFIPIIATIILALSGCAQLEWTEEDTYYTKVFLAFLAFGLGTIGAFIFLIYLPEIIHFMGNKKAYEALDRKGYGHKLDRYTHWSNSVQDLKTIRYCVKHGIDFYLNFEYIPPPDDGPLPCTIVTVEVVVDAGTIADAVMQELKRRDKISTSKLFSLIKSKIPKREYYERGYYLRKALKELKSLSKQKDMTAKEAQKQYQKRKRNISSPKMKPKSSSLLLVE